MMFIRSLFLAAGLAASLTSGAMAQTFGGHVEFQNIDRDGDLKVIAGSAEISGRIGEDFAVYGGSIEVDVEVGGDIRIAGGSVTAAGRAAGDGEFAGGSVEVDMDIGGDAEFAAGYVRYEGVIEGNLDTAVGALELLESSTVNGSADLTGQNITLRGRILGNLDALAEEVIISGRIDGNIDIEAEHLVIEPGAIINGRIEYSGPNPAEISPDAVMANDIEYTFRELDFDWDGDQFDGVNIDFDILPGGEFFAVAGVGFALLLGLIALLLMPRGVARLSRKFRRQPLLAPLLGLLLLPMGWLMLMMAVTVLLTVTVVGIVLIPFWWVFGLFVIILAYPLGAIAVGDLILARTGRNDPGLGLRLLGMFVILILASALWIVPPLAVISGVILSWIGLGSWVLAAFGSKDEPVAPVRPSPEADAV
ncbi:polymer-forming cytoskeletal protein [Hyphobacterium sp. CCMP332]|uniref:bactofilin family protein n=1 Tax=Hyphobacterium sp. CCMP332 TaxID=2749086 RepID=UPI001650B022|nr:polymer-forming cytoskeletal protein [Hyphobacterium sp. CCMP332]QNL18706.1 polymer-forming cytoskeletal protein [Hyphobacterium sp. CCMP332]